METLKERINKVETVNDLMRIINPDMEKLQEKIRGVETYYDFLTMSDVEITLGGAFMGGLKGEFIPLINLKKSHERAYLMGSLIVDAPYIMISAGVLWSAYELYKVFTL